MKTLAPRTPSSLGRPAAGFVAVAIVEDEAGISDDLQRLVNAAEDMACVCACRSVKSALAKIPPCVPDVIIMDLGLPDGTGVDCAARLKQLLPHTRIVAFTVHEDDEQLLNALRYGASGCLLKRSPPEEILAAIREAAAGGSPLSPVVAVKVVESLRREPPSIIRFEPLTRREGEILEFLAKGFPTKEISERLAISAGTVASHLKHIYEKLHVRSRTEAVIKYLEE